MLASVRAGFAAALVALVSFTASAADKAFQRSDLADSAVRLEAQIKTDAGQVAKPVAQLRARGGCGLPEERLPRRHADAGADRRGRAARSRQLAAALPRHPADPPRQRSRAHRLLLERAATAAYIAYQRSDNRGEEADALVAGRPHLRATASCGVRRSMRYRLSLDLREVADVRALYEKMREDHGFRMLDYYGRCGRGVAARLLPVLRGAARQAHRLLAVRRGRRPSTSPRSPPTKSSSASKA